MSPLKSIHLPYPSAIHPIPIPTTTHLPLKHPTASSPCFHILIYKPPIRLQFLILFLPFHPPTAHLKVAQQSNTAYICIKDINQLHVLAIHLAIIRLYRGPDKSLARPRRKQANVSVRMAWLSFGALPCKKKETRWQLASRCCWNRARPWHASELVFFLVGLRTYQYPGK